MIEAMVLINAAIGTALFFVLPSPEWYYIAVLDFFIAGLLYFSTLWRYKQQVEFYRRFPEAFG